MLYDAMTVIAYIVVVGLVITAFYEKEDDD